MVNSLPKGWCSEKLSTIAERITKGATPTSYGYKYQTSGIRFIKIENIKGGKVNHSSIRDFISIEANNNQRRSMLEDGDILFSIAGTIGVGCIIQKQDLPANTNQALSIIRGTKGFFVSGFLLNQLSSCFSQDQINRKSRGGGMNNISLRDVGEVVLSIPPLNEQRRIVDKLEKLLAKVDACKERLEKIPAILKRLRQSVLAAACSGRLTADWRETNLPDTLAREIIDRIQKAHNDVGGHKRGNAAAPTDDVHILQESDIPESWGIVELKDLCDPRRPITYGILKPGPDFPLGVPYVRVADFPKDIIELNQVRRTAPEIDAKYSRSKLRPDDILLSIRGTVGRVCFVPFELESANITQDSARLSIQTGLNTGYVAIVLRAVPTQMRIQKAVKGVAIRGINIGDVRALQIPFPPLNEQAEIVRRVEALFTIADDIEKRYQKAKAHVDKLTQSILAKAFRGELVPQDPNDEPAAQLLKRIQAERKNQEEEIHPGRKSTRRRMRS